VSEQEFAVTRGDVPPAQLSLLARFPEAYIVVS
jgi:hypothetical protein